MSPDPDVEAAAETGAQTRADCPEEHLAPADVAQEMMPEEADSVQLSQMFGGMFLTAWTIAQRAVESSPSKAYAQFLIERGVKPAWARGLASLMISRGVRLANENKRLPAVVGAIRFLAKPGRGRKAMARKAKVLLAAWEETSIIETIFDSASLSASDFIELLKSAVEGREVEPRRITEIAATIAPGLSIPRGPKISAASAAHEVLLEELGSVTGTRGFTWNFYRQDYSDPLTQETRREFREPDFAPQAARRRVKARLKANEKPR